MWLREVMRDPAIHAMRACLYRVRVHGARSLRRGAPFSSTAISFRKTPASQSGGASVVDKVRNRMQERLSSQQLQSTPPQPPQQASPKNGNRSVRRDIKVMTLPFTVALATARSFALGFAMSTLFFKNNPIKRKLYLLAVIFHHVIRKSKWVESVEENFQLKRLSKVYLPYWFVDASISTKCTGTDGEAELMLQTFGAQLPAHQWAPLRTMPIQLPRGDLETYVPFDAKKHLRLAGSSEKPLKEEEAAEMLPFTFSPLVLPQYLSSTSAPEQLKSAIVGDETITFNHKMIQTDMLAAYPVLLPFHMVLFHHKDEGIDRHITMAMPAWGQGPIPDHRAVVVKEELVGSETGQSHWSRAIDKDDSSYFSPFFFFLSLSTFPRLPIKATRPMSYPERSETDWDERWEEEIRTMKEELKKRGFDNEYEHIDERKAAFRAVRERLRDEASDELRDRGNEELSRRQEPHDDFIELLTPEAQARLLELIDWNQLQNLQEQAGKDQEATEESRAGLGESIDWNNPQIMRFEDSRCSENMRYLLAKTTFETLRLKVASYESITEEGSDNLWGESKSSADLLLEAQARTKKQMPQWLKSLRLEERSKRATERVGSVKRT